jgi:hypothetical protein
MFDLLVLFLFPQVIEGKLAPFLGKVIKFATAHVYSCSLCSQKGFICEICNNGEILYPFEDISTSRYRILPSTEMFLRVVCAFIWLDQDNSKYCLSLTESQVFPCFCTAVFSPCLPFSCDPHSVFMKKEVALLQRNAVSAVEQKLKERPSSDCPIWGSIPYTVTKPRHYCGFQQVFTYKSLL